MPTFNGTRRDFLKTSSLAVVGSAALGTLTVTRSAHAGGGDTLKVGLIGCGGRGTGAAVQALNADTNVKLVALGDTFADRVQKSLATLQEDSSIASKIDVPQERQFVGFDAYKQVINSGVDVVLLCTSPGFRPLHLQYAISQGKHVFAEKPVATDAPGVRSVLATAAQAKEKGLAIVSGLCWRYSFPKRESIKRIHEGAIGDVVAMHVSYNTGPLWHHGRQPSWTDMEYQIRNWLYFTWLSGDFNVEQTVHSLDKAAWIMHEEPPIKATGLGGRQIRVEEQWGHIFDHMAVVYEYKNGVKLFSNCRQQAGCWQETSDWIYGTKGRAELMKPVIIPSKGERWTYRGEDPNMYDQEHRELFASIRSGNPINNGEYMCKSTMMGIMGRMACYTGQTLTWEECLNSTENLQPAKYEWGPLPTPPVAKPGITPFA